jgi:hypothetical protein
MITALEAVGAMYGIPPSHIMGQPGLKAIRVENDMIVAPTDVKPNTKAIVCSIGAVLDQISQRINDKLDNFQADNIKKGSIDDKVAQTANPSKGTVIAHHTLSDGGEIIVYDSGLVDMPHTDEARAKVAELRASGEIPSISIFNDSKRPYEKPSFFTKEDDIALDDATNKRFASNDPTPTDISSTIHESDMHLEMCAHYNDTDHLGYDIFNEMGFDFIRVTESFVTEASKSKKKIASKDIKHMKFDNTEITKAIKCLNEARKAQPSPKKGDFDIKQFIEHPKYKEAIAHLSKQFDCQLSVYWHYDDEHADDTGLWTVNYLDHMYAQNITISKSKGFQLNGLPIQIHVLNKAIDEEMSREANVELFGQFVCAGLCHEIFHNIVNACRLNNAMFAFTLSTAMNMAEMTDDAKKKREIFERYAATLTKTNKGIVGKAQRRNLVKALCKASALSSNNVVLNDLQKSIKTSDTAVDNIDKLISHYEIRANELQRMHNSVERKARKYNKTGNAILSVVGLLLSLTVVGLPIGLPMLFVAGDQESAYEYMEKYKHYMKTPNKEEYYCDLFAGMYNLPLTFTEGYKKRDFTANQIKEEQLQRLTDLEGKIFNLQLIYYPTMAERNHAGYTVAKTILDSKNKIAPEYKEYCKWVVANYSNMEKTDIKTNFRSQNFDPREAEDLDRHVQNIIDNNNITMTEFAV